MGICFYLFYILFVFKFCVQLSHQEAITEYQGTVITVSHDRYFIKQIVNRVIEVKDGQLQDYAGDYNVSLPFFHFILFILYLFFDMMHPLPHLFILSIQSKVFISIVEGYFFGGMRSHFYLQR